MGRTLDKVIRDDIRDGLYKEVALKAEIRTRWESDLEEEERQE